MREKKMARESTRINANGGKSVQGAVATCLKIIKEAHESHEKVAKGTRPIATVCRGRSCACPRER